MSLEEIHEKLRSREIDQTWLVREFGEDNYDSVPLARLNELVNRKNKTTKKERPKAAEQEPAKESRADGEPGSSKKPPSVLIFRCVACSANIRAATSNIGKQAVRFGCGHCKQAYYAKIIDADGFGFLIIPELPTNNSTERQEKVHEVPPHVLAALKCFGLTSSATMDDVRAAFRQAIVKYHPDKVNHLGDELKSLAEKKTKEFNAHFSTLEKFFS